jgi:hypothetical protein
MIPRHSEGVFQVYSTSNPTARGAFSLQCPTGDGTASENTWKKFDSDFLGTQQPVLLRVIMWLRVKQIIPPRSRDHPLPGFSRSPLRGPRFVEVWWLALGVQISPTPHFSNCRDTRGFLAHLAPASRAANQNPAYEVEARGFVRREAEPTIKRIRARKFEDNSFITSHSSSQASQESSTSNLQTSRQQSCKYISKAQKRRSIMSTSTQPKQTILCLGATGGCCLNFLIRALQEGHTVSGRKLLSLATFSPH